MFTLNLAQNVNYFFAKLCYKSSHDREFPRFLYKYKQNEHPKQK